jgi:hypothetical protein
MYIKLDKEKPWPRCIRGLNLAVVRPTTDQLTADLEKRKLRHNLLQKTALTEILCMTCINVT